MKILRLPVALLLILQFVAAPPAGAETLPYSLVDKDQYAIFAEDQAAKQEEELALEDPPDDADLLKYTNEFWRQAVTAVEGSYKLDKGPEPIPDLTLLNPTLSLPLYGTSIALTGRYVLGFKMAAKNIKKTTTTAWKNAMTAVLRCSRKCSLKCRVKSWNAYLWILTTTTSAKRKNHLRGVPRQTGRTGAAGGIRRYQPVAARNGIYRLPKQLFGAKMHLQHQNANLYLIGSQTKGSSKQKQFVGSSVSEIVSLADTSYIRRTYYDLTFGGNIRPYIDDQGNIRYPVDRTAFSDWTMQMGSISPGTEEIYLDSNTTSSDYVPVDKTATDVLGGGDYQAKWQLLTRGVDYTVDYASGIITFKRTIRPRACWPWTTAIRAATS